MILNTRAQVTFLIFMPILFLMIPIYQIHRFLAAMAL